MRHAIQIHLHHASHQVYAASVMQVKPRAPSCGEPEEATMNSRPDGPQAAPAHPESGHPAPAEVASAFLPAFYTADFEAARALLAEDFSFSGPFVQVRGRDPFLDRAAGLKPIVRGHRLLLQWADSDEICSWYDLNLQTPVK